MGLFSVNSNIQLFNEKNEDKLVPSSKADKDDDTEPKLPEDDKTTSKTKKDDTSSPSDDEPKLPEDDDKVGDTTTNTTDGKSTDDTTLDDEPKLPEDDQTNKDDTTTDDGSDDKPADDAGSDTNSGDDTSSSMDSDEPTLPEDNNDGGDTNTPTDDTSDMGDDNTSSDDGSGDDQPSDDMEGEEEQTPEDKIKSLEGELFADLDTEDIAIKNKELKTKYFELYDSAVSLIDRINVIQRTEQNQDILNFAANKISELRQLILDYTTTVYARRSYMENAINFSQYLAVLSGINKLLQQIPLPEDS